MHTTLPGSCCTPHTALLPCHVPAVAERHLGSAPAASGAAPGWADGEAYEASVSQYPEVVQLRQLAQSGQSDIWTLIRLLVDDFCAKMTGPNSPGW